MPVQLPLGLTEAEKKREAANILLGKKQTADYVRQGMADLQANTDFHNDVQRRLVNMGPLPGMPVIPKGGEMLPSTAAPVLAPLDNDPNRGYMPLGRSPQLTRADIEGDPAPSGAQDGVGGPDQETDVVAMARAEKERRQQEGTWRGSSPSVQDQAKLEKARRQQAKQPAMQPATEIGTFFSDPALRSPDQTPQPQAGLRFDEPSAGKPYQMRAPLTAEDWDRQDNARLGDILLQNAGEIKPSGAQAFMANAYNSATLGQGDKLRGLAAMILGGDYDETVDSSRDWLRKSHEAEPGWSAAGDLAGFIVPGVGIGGAAGKLTQGAVKGIQRAAPALGFGAKTADAALQGAAAGGLYGFLTGAENRAIDQGDSSPDMLAPERFQSMQDNAAMGAAFGAAMPALGVVTRPARNMLGGLGARFAEPFAPGSIAAHNQKIGADAARRAFERAGILNLDDLMKRAAKYGDKPVVAGELSQGTLNNMTALTRGPGTTPDKAMAVLEDRISGMPERMLRDLAQETGLSPNEVMGTVDDMIKASRERAAPLYENAEAAPFAETANLERIVNDAPILRGLMPKAIGRVQNQAVPKIGQADQMPPLKVYDELKQLVDEEIQARIANGQGIDDIEGVRKALVDELDLISGQAATGSELPAAGSSLYAAAREAGGDAPRIQSGLQSGERAMSGAKLADDVAAEVSAISGQELTAYQMGVVRDIVKRVENGTLTPKQVNNLGFKKKLREVFGDAAADGLIRKFGIEADLSQKGARWNPNVGSVTSQAMLGGPSKVGDEMMRLGANAATGNKVAIVAQMINALRRRGYSENQLNEIGNIFLSSPEDAGAAMFPGQTPTPGAVPPMPPPAGRVRENPPTGGGPSGGGPSPSSISESLPVASATLPDGQTVNVQADVFQDRGAVVMSPNWPSNVYADAADALKSRQSPANGRGIWSEENPEVASQIDQQVASRFIGLMKGNDAPAHVLALNPEASNWALGGMIEDALPPGRVLLRSKDGGEFAVVDKRWLKQNPQAFPEERWTPTYIRYSQEKGVIPGGTPEPQSYEALSAQSREAWNSGQWEKANELQQRANELRVIEGGKSQSPKTEAPSQGGAKPPEKAGLFPSKPLDMSEPARMQRAREQGFDVDTPLYHGTDKNIEAFDSSLSKEDGTIFLTDSPRVAESFAFETSNPFQGRKGGNVMPVYARGNYLTVEGGGKPIRDVEGNVRLPDMKYGETVREYARRKGYDGIRFKDVVDNRSRGSDIPASTVIAVFDPSNIRGKFAAFDPSQSGSSKLLAGMTGLGGLGLLSAAITADKKEMKKPRQ